MNVLIAVDVSALENREQKADVVSAFEACGWTYDGNSVIRFEPLTGLAVIGTYYFQWEKFETPVYPSLPPKCRITENPLV